ncbi:8719_t:CDS:1, partial [Diversispora eburnea]
DGNFEEILEKTFKVISDINIMPTTPLLQTEENIVIYFSAF